MGLVVDRDKCDLCGVCVEACPFAAITITDGSVMIGEACRMCKICIKKCPQGAISLAETSAQVHVDKRQWQGIMVFVEHEGGKIHPVTWELVGKARELAGKIGQSVSAVFLGENITKQASLLLDYGVDQVFVYDNPQLRHFRVDAYADAFADCIRKNKPNIVLVGATSVGRSLAPRLATRFRTGLTADCTSLDVKENTDLVQIRPAFGGNIMAKIITPNHRPQFATIRYRVMDSAQKVSNPSGKVEICGLEDIQSLIRVEEVRPKAMVASISEAEVLVVAGRGLKDKKDLDMVRELAGRIGGQVAVTRPLVEAGWESVARQIGLSGRTVRPKLLIALGISGAIQFIAGMSGADCIIAINKDDSAPIFDVAHYGIVGDIYDVIPNLLKKMEGKGNHEE